MGQSMDKPAKASLRQSKARLSARSLQKQSCRMTINSKKGSLSASKMQNIESNEQISVAEYSENTKIRNGELNINSKYVQNSINVKEVNQIMSQKIALGGETEVHSPNFREIAEGNNEYGLTHWNAHSTSKDISPNDTHNHDITISFNRAKNNLNVFQEEPQVRKSKLKKILEEEQESINQKSKLKKENTENNLCQWKEIENLTALKSVYSENYKTPKESLQDTPKKSKKQESCQGFVETKKVQTKEFLEAKHMKEPKTKVQGKKQNMIKHEKKDIQQTNSPQTHRFNDYDTDFHANQNEAAGEKKTFKISKKMQQLKEKIANRSNLNRDKLQVSRYSMQRLSASFRKYRNSCSFDKSPEAKKEKKTYERIKKLKQKLSKTQFVGNETSQQHQNTAKRKISNEKIVKKQQKNQNDSPKMKEIKVQVKIQQLRKVKSNEKIIKIDPREEKTAQKQNKAKESQKKIRENQKKVQLFVFNDQNTYLFKKAEGRNCRVIQEIQKVQQSPNPNQKEKKISFTQMVKKEHFNNKFKKTKAESANPAFLKFSHVQQAQANPKQSNLFSSTCDQKRFSSNLQYQFFDYRDSSKSQKDNLKLKSNQINSLKKITEELNSKSSQKKSNMNSMNLSKNTSTQEHSLKNKTFQQKPVEHEKQNLNLTTMSFMNVQGNFEEYMLKDALGRFQEGKQKLKQEKRKSKSTQSFTKLSGNGKNKLIIF